MMDSLLETAKALFATLGPFWAGAVACECLTVFAESWGGLRVKPEGEEEPNRGFAGFVAQAAAIVAPLVLLTHGFFASIALSPSLALYAAGAVVAAVLAGAVLGWLFGAIAKPAAPVLHFLAGPLSFVTVVLALIAAWPSLPLIFHGLMLVFARFV